MKLKYDFEIMDMGDQVMAVPVGDNAHELHGVIRLNETGAELLKMIQAGMSEDQMVETLGKKYETAESEIRAFVTEFVANFKEAGLFE